MLVKISVVSLVTVAGIVGMTSWHPADTSAASLMSPMPTAGTPGARMLPSRLLSCTLRRITNFNPNKAQAPSDFTFEGSHVFKLYLPSIPVRTAPPPESTQPPEPVDPRTKIIADPDGLSHQAAGSFMRVVDYWPDRVEMSAPVSDTAVNLIIIDQIDPRQANANLFMTKANDAVTYDLDHLYAGKCAISAGT